MGENIIKYSCGERHAPPNQRKQLNGQLPIRERAERASAATPLPPPPLDDLR